MGNNLAQELASGEFNLPLAQQIEIQLTGNHYPPVPTSMVLPCIEAIEAINDGDSERLIDLPDKVLYRGATAAPARAIAQAHHLDAWIDELTD